MRGGLKWLVAGAIAVALHAALLIGTDARLHGDVSPPAGPLMESAASLSGIVGSETVIEAVAAPEEQHVEAEVVSNEFEATRPQEQIEVAVDAPLIIPEITDAPSEVLAEVLAEAVPEAPVAEPELNSIKTASAIEGHAAGQTEDNPEDRPDAKPEAISQQAPKKQTSKPKTATQRGNASQGGAGANGGQGGKATASAGAVSIYAAQVRARILARSPSGSGTQGTTVIRFGVSLDGSLRFASVASSSGNGALDARALATVRVTSFPPPPPGASLSQLSFSIPFHFK